MAESKIPNNFCNETMMSMGGFSGNANEMMKSGIYRNVDGTIANTPTENGLLIVFQGAVRSCFQIFVDFGNNVQCRINWAAGSTNWSSWKSL